MTASADARLTDPQEIAMKPGQRLPLPAVLAVLLATGLVAAALAPALASRPAAGDPTQRGPHPVATAQVGYTYDKQTETVNLYYPSDGGPSPVVVLLPSGATGDATNHVGHGQHLASWGYVVGILTSVRFVDGTDVLPNAERASAALDAINASDKVQVTDRAGIVGTHFNGVSALRATLIDRRFRVVVGLNPEIFPYSSTGAASVTVPYLVLGGNATGGLLCMYTNSWNQLYLTAASAHKSVYLFADAHPADFQDPPYDDPFNFCGQPRAKPFVWITGLMTAWLEYYLRGATAQYGALYHDGGLPSKPLEVSDSVAANAPKGLTGAAVGQDGALLHWKSVISDTMVLSSYDVLRARGNDPYTSLARPGLDQISYQDSALEQGTAYHYSLTYRDKAGNGFQTAVPVTINGGAPTVTPTRTATPTRTIRPTSTQRATYTPRASNTPRITGTPGSTRTATVGPTESVTPPVVTPRAYLPLCRRNWAPAP
jgi:hypothetical protein